jgi:hypothetical protein
MSATNIWSNDVAFTPSASPMVSTPRSLDGREGPAVTSLVDVDHRLVIAKARHVVA